MAKSRRGFAAMDPAKQRAIASKGGKKAHELGTAHEFTAQQAQEAGRKGGRAAHAGGKAHKFTHAEAVAAGRKGGLNSHRAARLRGTQTNSVIVDDAAKIPETTTDTGGQGDGQ